MHEKPDVIGIKSGISPFIIGIKLLNLTIGFFIKDLYLFIVKNLALKKPQAQFNFETIV